LSDHIRRMPGQIRPSYESLGYSKKRTHMTTNKKNITNGLKV